MKNLKILFITVVLACFVGISQTNAQAFVDNGPWEWFVTYEVDGVVIEAVAVCEYHYVVTPSGKKTNVLQGIIVGDHDGNDVPFPESAVKYVMSDGWFTVVITPSGEVTIRLNKALKPEKE